MIKSIQRFSGSATSTITINPVDVNKTILKSHRGETGPNYSNWRVELQDSETVYVKVYETTWWAFEVIEYR